jgi:predicted Zn-dependent protease
VKRGAGMAAGSGAVKCFGLLLCRLGIVGLIALIGCGPGFREEQEGQGPGRRPQQLVLTPEQELELGRRAYLQVLSEMRGRILPADDPQVRRSRAIVGKLVRAVGNEPLQREINLRLRGYQFDWEVNVVSDNQINAFCLPGGKMIVFTGILAVAENDDQLACVLGHEIAHALAHHVNERVARDESGRVSFLRGKAYDRQQESEADHIGLFLMTFAGYDPEQAVPFWEHMREISGQHEHPPTILSDHPSDAQRIAQIKAWVPAAKAAKQAYDHGRIAQPH